MSMHHCGADHQDNEVARTRCDYRDALTAALVAFAAGRVDAVAVRDLFAHAQTIYDDGDMAARWVRQVVDLGWRPGGAS